MPRTAERYSTTPFARVLTAFMWSKTPPWTSAKLAAVLGIARSRVGNWIYKDITPEIETMFVVFTRLNIPLIYLLRAYEEDGQLVPPLTDEDARRRQQQPQQQRQEQPPQPQPQHMAQSALPSSAQQTALDIRQTAGQEAPQTPQTYVQSIAVPHGRKGRKPAHATSPSNDGGLPSDATTTSSEARSVETRTEEWRILIAQTRQLMAQSNLPKDVLDSVIQHLEDTHAGTPTYAERSIAAEHQQPRDPQEPQQVSPHTTTPGKGNSSAS